MELLSESYILVQNRGSNFANIIMSEVNFSIWNHIYIYISKRENVVWWSSVCLLLHYHPCAPIQFIPSLVKNIHELFFSREGYIPGIRKKTLMCDLPSAVHFSYNKNFYILFVVHHCYFSYVPKLGNNMHLHNGIIWNFHRMFLSFREISIVFEATLTNVFYYNINYKHTSS